MYKNKSYKKKQRKGENKMTTRMKPASRVPQSLISEINKDFESFQPDENMQFVLDCSKFIRNFREPIKGFIKDSITQFKILSGFCTFNSNTISEGYVHFEIVFDIGNEVYNDMIEFCTTIWETNTLVDHDSYYNELNIEALANFILNKLQDMCRTITFNEIGVGHPDYLPYLWCVNKAKNPTKYHFMSEKELEKFNNEIYSKFKWYVDKRFDDILEMACNMVIGISK